MQHPSFSQHANKHLTLHHSVLGSFRLSEMAGPRRTLARAPGAECEQCGSFCDWDDESEWEEK